MSTFGEIKAAIDQTGAAFEEFKKTNDARLKALSEGNESKAAELDQKLGRIEADLKKYTEVKATAEREIQFLRDRVEELETKGMNPGRTAVQKLEDEYKAAFTGWVRSRGQSVDDERKMQDIQRKAAAVSDTP